MSKATERSLALLSTDSSARGVQTQKVAPFLQKLYQIVDDPDSQHLMRWSDTGDSIIILDRDRLSREILPRWFKHNNYPTFVRQLNMYGFRKIPRLHQGALIPAPSVTGELETEDYENEFFKRGQPDLLSLITRKGGGKKEGKGKEIDAAPSPSVDSTATMTVGAEQHVGESGTNVDSQTELALPPSPSSLNISSIVSSITDIKRNQSAISAELNALRQENQALWQEALRAREGHQRQQETINRIMMFLAGVFGRGGGYPAGVTGKGKGIMPAQMSGVSATGPQAEQVDDSLLGLIGRQTINQGGNQLPSTPVSPSHPVARKRRRLSEIEGDAWVDTARGNVGGHEDVSARFMVVDDNSSNASASSPPDTSSLFGSLSPATDRASVSPVMKPKAVTTTGQMQGSLDARTRPLSPQMARTVVTGPAAMSQALLAPQTLQRAQDFAPEKWQTLFDALNLGSSGGSQQQHLTGGFVPAFSGAPSAVIPTSTTIQQTQAPTLTHGQVQSYNQSPLFQGNTVPAPSPISVSMQTSITPSPLVSTSTPPDPNPNTSFLSSPISTSPTLSSNTSLGLTTSPNPPTLDQLAYSTMQNTSDLEARIGSTQASIDELVANLGIDPGILANFAAQGGENSIGTGDVFGGVTSSSPGLASALTPTPTPGVLTQKVATPVPSPETSQMDLDEFMKLLSEMS